MIKPVFRVQCDGPGREWLSLPDGHVPGTDLPADTLVAAPTAERAGNWPDEKAAKRATIAAGWGHRPDSDFKTWFCPGCLSPAGGEETSG